MLTMLPPAPDERCLQDRTFALNEFRAETLLRKPANVPCGKPEVTRVTKEL
jgi:hypothetical protein